MLKPLEQVVVNNLELRFDELNKRIESGQFSYDDLQERDTVARTLDKNDRLIAFIERGFKVILGGMHESNQEPKEPKSGAV